MTGVSETDTELREQELCDLCDRLSDSLKDGVCDACLEEWQTDVDTVVEGEESRIVNWSAYASELLGWGINRSELASWLSVRSKTVQRWQKSDKMRPHQTQRQKLAAVRILIDSGECRTKYLPAPPEAVMRKIRGAIEKAGGLYVDHSAGPRWLQGLQKLLVDEAWGPAETMAKYLHPLARTQDDPDVLCLFYVRWGIAARRLGMPYKQLALCRKARSIAREKSVSSGILRKVYNAAGCAYTRLREFDRASTEFERALEISPNYLPAIYNLLAICAMQHKLEGCRKWDRRLRNAAASDPSFDVDDNIRKDSDMTWWREQIQSAKELHYEMA